MPREIWVTSPESAEIREYEQQEPGEGEVRVRSLYAAAKHGTEMSGVKGYARHRGSFDSDLGLFEMNEGPGRPRESRPGNMFVGEVTKTGSGVSRLAPGERVLSFGPFREEHVVPASRCRTVPEGMPWKSAVCLDPADFAVGAVRDGQVRVGDAVALFGMGAIGLMAVQVVKLSGAYPIIAIDPLPNRRQAAQALDADLVLDPTVCDAGLEIRKATGKRGADVVIEYSGSAQAMQAALRGVAFGGTVVAGAFPPPYTAGLDFGAEAHINRPNIVFTRACSDPNRDHPRWDEQRIFDTCWRLLADGRLTGEPVVSPVVPFEELVGAYPKIASDPGSSIKLGAEF